MAFHHIRYPVLVCALLLASAYGQQKKPASTPASPSSAKRVVEWGPKWTPKVEDLCRAAKEYGMGGVAKDGKCGSGQTAVKGEDGKVKYCVNPKPPAVCKAQAPKK